MSKFLRGCLTQVGLMVFAWIAMIYMMQDSLVYHPRQYEEPLHVALDKEPALQPKPFEAEELEFVTEDGEQTAILYKTTAAHTRRLYAVFGGNAMVARDWLYIFSRFAWDAGGATSFVLVDYPGFGLSSGKPTKETILRTAKGALVEALSTLGSDSTTEHMFLGAIGHSIGCSVALKLALEWTQPRLQHLVISAPFTSIAEMAGILLPPLRVIPAFLIDALASRHAWDNREMAQALAGPTAPRVDMYHGKRDEICPYEMGVELSKLLKKLGFSVTFDSNNAGHNNILSTADYQRWLKSLVSAA